LTPDLRGGTNDVPEASEVEQNIEKESKSEMHVPVSEAAVGATSNNVVVGAGSPNLLVLVGAIDSDGDVDTSQSLTPNGDDVSDEEASHKADAFFGETCSTNDDNIEPTIPDVEGKHTIQWFHL
jgi:hypothetical protein